MEYTGSAEGRVGKTNISFGVVSLTDTEAVDQIHKLMDGLEWSADTLDEMARLVELTGRLIQDPNDIEVS
jgi:hypothetical protein